MFYLAKFCRICVQAGGTLVDIETTDVDSITLSEKLEACTSMVINRESLSKEICMQCIKKLRICYDFQDMCKQSTRILEGYLKELISTTDKVNVNNFVNSQLRVTITPLTKNSILQSKRRRITKEERCSLLKQLLSSSDNSKDKGKLLHHAPIRPPDNSHKGGLRGIINFTSNYDFGYKIDKNHNLEATPLDKLTAFSHNFFKNNLTHFSQSLLNILDIQSQYDSDEHDMFNEVAEEEDPPKIKIEELVIEPDIKREVDDEENDYDCESYAANFVETTLADCDLKKEEILIECSSSTTATSNSENYDYILPMNSQTSSMNMLDKFVEKFSNCKIFSKHSIRCRTRGSPYINPHLREQFQQRCFKCNKCSRYFKSPGYLKAHISKIHLSRVNN